MEGVRSTGGLTSESRNLVFGTWQQQNSRMLNSRGAEHCQVDNGSMAVDYMADWVAETLGGDPKGV